MAANKPDIRIFPDIAALSEAAAALFVASCAQAAAERGGAMVALSGGTTPAKLYELLVHAPYSEQVDWSRMDVFWGDERCVPPADPESNYHQANEALLSHVPIPKENIHRVKSEMEPRDAALDYALTLMAHGSSPLNWPRFDLVLLGMGDDGHTASLFPHSPVETSVPTAAVTAEYQGRPAQRVTLTPPVFNAARRVAFLVSGESKSTALANVLNGSYEPARLPAQRVRPTDGELFWLVDQAAASKL